MTAKVWWLKVHIWACLDLTQGFRTAAAEVKAAPSIVTGRVTPALVSRQNPVASFLMELRLGKDEGKG